MNEPTLPPSDPLADLAGQINDAHRQWVEAATSALTHARRAGELLIEAKGKCGHGEWLPWLAAHFDFSERTAQNYMRLFREWPALVEANPQRVADLTYKEAVRLLEGPKGDDQQEPEPAVTVDTAADGEKRHHQERLASERRNKRHFDRHQKKAGNDKPAAPASSARTPDHVAEKSSVATPSPLQVAWESATLGERREFCAAQKAAIGESLLLQEGAGLLPVLRPGHEYTSDDGAGRCAELIPVLCQQGVYVYAAIVAGLDSPAGEKAGCEYTKRAMRADAVAWFLSSRCFVPLNGWQESLAASDHPWFLDDGDSRPIRPA